MTCRNDVHRILIEPQPKQRTWHVVDVGASGYEPHRCPGAPPPRDPSLLKKAA
jgi:hypothetical protein